VGVAKTTLLLIKPKGKFHITKETNAGIQMVIGQFIRELGPGLGRRRIYQNPCVILDNARLLLHSKRFDGDGIGLPAGRQQSEERSGAGANDRDIAGSGVNGEEQVASG